MLFTKAAYKLGAVLSQFFYIHNHYIADESVNKKYDLDDKARFLYDSCMTI